MIKRLSSVAHQGISQVFKRPYQGDWALQHVVALRCQLHLAALIHRWGEVDRLAVRYLILECLLFRQECCWTSGGKGIASCANLWKEICKLLVAPCKTLQVLE